MEREIYGVFRCQGDADPIVVFIVNAAVSPTTLAAYVRQAIIMEFGQAYGGTMPYGEVRAVGLRGEKKLLIGG